jgi:DNA-binding MarR family transcriptional regulator
MRNGPARALVADLEGTPRSTRDRVLLFRTLIVLGGQLRTRMDRRYRQAGITTQQAAVLALLQSAASPLSQGDVARLLGVTQQNVRQLVDALASKRLLKVRTPPGDHRVKRLVPTRRVARLFADRNADDYAAIAEWFGVLDDGEVKSLLHQLGRLLAAMAPNPVTGRDA